MTELQRTPREQTELKPGDRVRVKARWSMYHRSVGTVTATDLPTENPIQVRLDFQLTTCYREEDLARETQGKTDSRK